MTYISIRILGVIACSSLLVLGCRRAEIPVKPHEAGNVTAATIDMDPLYKYQIYYNLHANAEVGRNLKTVWDLGFETSAEGFHVVLNGAASVFAMATPKTDFADVDISDTVGFAANRKWDSYTGSSDSTAIGDWRAAKPVFIIDRGFDEKGLARGWSKVQLLSVSATAYTVRLAALDGTNEHMVNIAKDSSYNLSFLSLSSGLQVMVEPPKASWDIALSQYTYIFYDMDPPVPYLVTGCLLNRHATQAYEDTMTVFEATSLATVRSDRLSSSISAIGYDWKVFNGSKYTVRPNNYIIRDAKGLFYKLRFTGFYNDAGVKGNPQWEYQQL